MSRTSKQAPVRAPEDQTEDPPVAPTESAVPIESFVRIKKHKLKNGDHWESFQPEVVYVQGDKVVDRKMVSKPDMFEMAFAIAADMVDPRNDEKPTPAPF